MQKLAEICINRPVFASVLILLLVVVGAVGFTRLGVDRFPKVEFPFISVVTVYPGASPEAIETEVSDKIEGAVNTISGIEDLRSYSNEGVSTVVIQFALEKDGDVAAQEVRDKINTVLAELPTGIDPPVVQKNDTDAAPILGLAVAGKGSIRNVTEFADKKLRRRLESTPGVGRIDVLGGRKRQINVQLDAFKMRGYGVTVTDVTRALQQQNAEIPGGRIDQGDTSVTLRTRGRLQSVKDFNDIVLRAQNGGAVTLGDVARVEDGLAEANSASEISGQPTVLLSVSKQSGTNTIAVISEVKARLRELGGEAMGDKKADKFKIGTYEVRIVNDQSDYIESAIHSVEEHLIVGSILASIVVLIFLLNWRSTLISAISIPTSIIATFGLMWVMGFTLNILTLLALTLSVGIVIDDAIVVLENIYRFIDEKGMPPFQAALEATNEIGLAVMATTLSLVAVFLPVAFMSGIVGRFMNSFGVTMSFAILVSLVVAFTLTPTMSARMLKATHDKKPVKDGKNAHDPTTKEKGFFRHIDRFYGKMVRWSLNHRWAIGLLCVAAFLTMPLTVPLIPKNFLPEDDESQFSISMRAPEGTSLEKTGEIARQVSQAVQKLPETDYTLLTIGGGGQSAARNNASIYVRLKPLEKREKSQTDIMGEARAKILPQFEAENLRTSVGPATSVGGGGGPQGGVQYVLSGPELKTLENAANAIIEKMRGFPGVVDLDSSLVSGRPELSVDVDRQMAAQVGVQPVEVAQALNFLVGDNKVTDYYEGGEQYEVHVRAAPEYRADKNGISLLTVSANPTGTSLGENPIGQSDGSNFGATSVPIEQVVTFKRSTGPATIQRLNRQREVTVSANTLPGASSADVLARMEKLFAEQNLGPAYNAEATGRSKEMGKAFSAFIVAFGLSLAFVYLILAAQFESWIHPVTILISLPLTVPFALISILIFGGSLNIFSMLGILVLFGVVKKNAILQIDHTNQLRAKGMPRDEAIIQANRDRLRPILMTTVAFVAGMLPLVVSSGVGAGTNRAIGSVIFGGQTLSLLLTLLATPVFYSWFDDLSGFAARVRGKVFGGKKASSAKPEAIMQAREQ